MSRRIIAFDTETYPYGAYPEGVASRRQKVSVNVVPRMVCMTSHDGNRTEFLRGGKAVDQYIYWLSHGTRLVAHNLAFDAAVMVRAAMEFAGKDILDLTFEAFESGRFSCSRVRQQLIDNARIGLKDHGYPLSALVKKYCGVDITASKKSADVWRTRYNELDKFPTIDWPEAAVAYAKEDAEWHYRVWMAQQEVQYSCIGQPISGPHGVLNEQLQCMRTFALQLVSAWGFRADLEWAERVKAKYDALQADIETKLKKFGLLKPNGVQNKEETMRVYASTFRALGEEPMKTNPSKTYPEGQVSTSSQARNAIEDLLEIHGVPEEQRDPRFQLLALWSKLSKFQSTYIEPVLLSRGYSICSSFDFVATGRTSSSKPNLQNLPKRDRPEDPFKASDIRRIFIPREGNVFVDCDYATLELRTFAQVCLNLGLYSDMAEALLRGRDLHTDFAAQLLGMDYDECIRILENRAHPLYKKVKWQRDLSKVANFGLPGGLGARAFVRFARGVGVKLSLPVATDLRQHHRDRWSEMQEFFGFINDLKLPGQHHTETGDLYGIEQHGPNGATSNWRTRACDRYTSACNTYFQGLAADGCSLALWKIVRACYSDVHSPLYGYRVNMFIHDQFLLEGPEAGASAAAYELQKLMREGMEPFVPGIPVESEVAVGRRWDVEMKSKMLEDGSLTIYEPSYEAAA